MTPGVVLNGRFLWFDDTPSFNKIGQYLTYWSNHVTALNPDPGLLRAARVTSSRTYSERANNLQELAECINRFQRHTMCMTWYCKRLERHTGKEVCRFGLPWPESKVPTIINRALSSSKVFELERNDSIMSKYNPTFTMGLQANSDFSPCTDKHAVIYYLAKYCTKIEKRSIKLQGTIREVLPAVRSTGPIQSLSRKLVNHLIGERDWSG